MKNPRQLIKLAAVAATCGLLLASCGGGKTNTTTSATQVTAADSPIPNTTGVKTSLDDGTQVYLLSENTNTDETRSMKIVSNPNKTGGDASALVGKTFLEFDNLSGVHDKAVVSVKGNARVNECNLTSAKCIVIGYSRLTEGTISFSVKAGHFYAVE